MKGYFRGHRTFILKLLKPLGLSRRRSLVQTILILVIESGLVYLGIQVSCFGIVLPDIPGKILKVLTFLTDSIPLFHCAYAPRASLFIRRDQR